MSNLVTEETLWLRTPVVPRRVPMSTPVSALLFRAITTDVSGLMTVEAENAPSGPRDGESRSSY